MSFNLQVEALNVWNHPVFSTLDMGINNTTFGTISGTQVGPRNLQFRGQIVF